MPKIDFAAYLEPVAMILLGKPNDKLSSAHQFRFGNRGSIAVELSGDRRGTWYDHENKVGGSTLDLIMHVERHQTRLDAVRRFSALFPHEMSSSKPERRTVSQHQYKDKHGQLKFEVLRYHPKNFRQRRPDPEHAGKYIWNLNGITPLPYRLPDVLRTIGQGECVFIVEGEKDVDRLFSLGLTATCNSGGAGKWCNEHSKWLKGARVAIVPDNDEAGRNHANDVAHQLAGVVSELCIIDLELKETKADVSDWLNTGNTAEALLGLAKLGFDCKPKHKSLFPNLVWLGREDDESPLSWLVRGLLTTGGLSTVFGAPKSTKTFFALDIGLHVAHQRNWSGRPTMGGGVVYVCGEGAAGVRLRMKAWRKKHMGRDDAPFVMIPQSINLFDDDKQLKLLIDQVNVLSDQMGVPVSLIVLDTLGRMLGTGDEDKARDINAFVRAVERIQSETGAHVMIVHHSGKDRDKGMRGSNALLAAVDVAIEVTRQVKGECQAKVTAMKDGAEVGPFQYTLEQTIVGINDDGTDILSCVIAHNDREHCVSTDQSKLTASDHRALQILRTALNTEGTFRNGERIVPLGTWRTVCYTQHSGSQEAKKKFAQRATKSLLDLNLARSDGDYIWIASDVTRRPGT